MPYRPQELLPSKTQARNLILNDTNIGSISQGMGMLYIILLFNSMNFYTSCDKL
jgi:hypothetical protein